ncbi:monosaccharide ABC transporter substrate-binding protein (CUT2 family) [Halanaerobium saccharolyticum]|uniref:Monosaccharide ABC transporter substrate-binding protein (CUT2 family) n=1 Tax=Halanaerobium saccharolyticum TaxID=43595 RepID=A0A4R6LHG6_9FIRM|nr:sugar ABC transporter substrate-binding protein [Halanaerobium saccharolyticum]TDO83418.1 monosaccharide ABC transporter substrate-binding protein (CUT2 family) [Halanaerobium saccharolyticum]
MKKYLSSLLVVVMVLTLSLAFVGQQAKAQEDEQMEFTLVAHSAAISFWRPVKRGMQDAAEQLGVKVNFTGPPKMNHSRQVAIIENLISSNVDGIGTTITSPTAYDNIVQKALDNGIPVIAFNTDDTTPNPRMAYIGQTPVEAGKRMGQEIVEYIEDGSKIAFLIGDPGHTALQARLKGAQQILDQHNISYDVIDTTTDLANAVSTVMNYYRGHQDVAGWFGVSATATAGGAKAAEKLGLKGEIVAGGFDLTPTTLQAIKDGYAKFTVDQNPYLQGYYTVHALYLYNKYALSPSNINTGGGIIDSSNVEKVIDLAQQGYR